MWPALVALLLPARAAVPGESFLRSGERAAAEPVVGALESLPIYRIEQRIDDVAATFSGTATLQWTNTTGRTVAMLPLLLHPSASAEQGARDAGQLVITDVEGGTPVGKRPTLVEIQLDAPLAPNGVVTLEIGYQGRLRRLAGDVNDPMAQALGQLGTLMGGGAADYGLVAVGDGLLTAASAYPMVAPHRDGVFATGAPGRLGDLAWNEVSHFEVTTTVPKGFTLVTNLADSDPEPAGDDVVVRSSGAMMRDFVLVGGRDLRRNSKQVGDVRVTTVSLSRDARAADRALEVGVASLKSFEKRFGRYPFRELDIVEASLVGGAGGVEFPGMCLIAGMLYRPLGSGGANDPLSQLLGGGGGAPVNLDDMLDFVVAHEVAHQWFAGIVGNDAQKHPSLDEPLAQYAASLAIRDLRGRTAAEAALNKQVKVNYAMWRVAGGPDRPVLRQTTEYGSAMEYAGLVYGKAPFLYVHLADELGADTLHAGIRAGVAKYRFGLVSTEDWSATVGQGNPEVAAAFDRWLKGTHGDVDLGVDDSGDFVFKTMFPPEMVEMIDKSVGLLGMNKRDLLRMMLGGGLPGMVPPGR